MKMIGFVDNGEDRLIGHLSTKYGRDIESLENLSYEEADYSIKLLRQQLGEE
jgi:hypothetical protein